MRRFARLRRLSPREQRLVAAAWVGLAVVRPALAFLPFRLLRAWAECEPARRRAEGHPDPERAAALVEAAAAHHLLATTCLARALVLCRLLRRRGFPARLYVGASRTGALFEAHAWVTCGDCALTAGRAIERFEALLPEAPATAAEGR
jgi:hypothetical protein